MSSNITRNRSEIPAENESKRLKTYIPPWRRRHGFEVKQLKTLNLHTCCNIFKFLMYPSVHFIQLLVFVDTVSTCIIVGTTYFREGHWSISNFCWSHVVTFIKESCYLLTDWLTNWLTHFPISWLTDLPTYLYIYLLTDLLTRPVARIFRSCVCVCVVCVCVGGGGGGGCVPQELGPNN